MRNISRSWTHTFRRTLLALILLSLSFIFYSLWQNTDAERGQTLSDSHPHISQQFSYYVEPSSENNPQSIVNKLEQFTETTPDNIPFSLGEQVYWVMITLENPSESALDLVLHIDNSMMQTKQAFSLEQSLLPILNNADKPNRHTLIFPHVELSIDANSQRILLLKLQAGGPPNIPLVFYEKSHFAERSLTTLIFYGAFIAIILVMTSYNLILYTAIRDKVYLLYVGYLLSTFIVLTSVIGFGYLVFPVDVQQTINQYSLFFHYYLVIFLLLFSLFFLGYDTSKGVLYRVGLFFSLGLVILSFFSLLLEHEAQATLFFSLQPIFYLFSIVVVLRRVKRSYAWARFYFISWIPLLVGAAVQPLMLLNQFEYSFLTRNAFMFGVLIEILFMAFALAERMRRFEVERIREMSYHPYTQIPRKALMEKAVAELAKQDNRTFSVVVIEPEQIDRIALYLNDVQKGRLIKRMYKRLLPLFAYNDAVVRLGEHNEKICLLSGNRLAILVDHKHSQQSLSLLIHSIQELVEEAYELDELKLPLSAVVGVANAPEHGNSGYVLLNKAQIAIVQAAKKHKKWSYFEKIHSEKTSDYLSLAADMSNAINAGDFTLHHQPQIDLKTMKVCGSEVLLRWEHKEQGAIPPDVFIPIAEDMGLINRLTQWVIKQAITQQMTLIENGYNHMISINISGKDVADDSFYDFVVNTLDSSELSPNKIAFELTESATISNNSEAIGVVEQLAELGVTISIDDFGTGYSSMAYVNTLPFKELKVDRQFVENVCDDIKRKVIAETTVRMAKGLGLEVVAEGINSKQDEQTLRQFGCDIGQGYFYAKPMPLNDYLIWLADEVNGHVMAQEQCVPEGEFIPKA